MWKEVRTCILLFVALSLLTGFIYPVVMTALAQVIFPKQANGTVIRKDGQIVGSKLIGQQFTDPRYFWGRPSSTAPPYNASASTGSNLGPANPQLLELIKARVQKLREADPNNTMPIPVDLVTASASGLDPHISVAAARYQQSRIARLRKIPEPELEELIRRNTTPRFLGVLGEPAVNVLQLNLTLDVVKQSSRDTINSFSPRRREDTKKHELKTNTGKRRLKSPPLCCARSSEGAAENTFTQIHFSKEAPKLPLSSTNVFVVKVSARTACGTAGPLRLIFLRLCVKSF